MGSTDILLVQEVCRVVCTRSAKLAAAGNFLSLFVLLNGLFFVLITSNFGIISFAAIACLCKRINEPDIYVGIDGSTYKLLPFFEHFVVENLKKLVDPSQKKVCII